MPGNMLDCELFEVVEGPQPQERSEGAACTLNVEDGHPLGDGDRRSKHPGGPFQGCLAS